MAEKNELIELSEIKCEKIVKEIKAATQIIANFRNVLNKHLKHKPLKEPQIYIVRCDGIPFSDDDNTTSSSYEYNIYWCFPYINVEEAVSINRLFFHESYMWPKYLLFFKLTMRERIKNHKYKGGRFFKLFLIEEEKIVSSEVTPIACYNDNFKLICMLNAKNIRFCIEKINEVFERLKFEQIILEELSEKIEIPNIEEYIKKNSRKE